MMACKMVKMVARLSAGITVALEWAAVASATVGFPHPRLG